MSVYQQDALDAAPVAWWTEEQQLASDSKSDRAWFRYCERVETALGIKSLDGDEATDGYSLDSACDAFDAGISASDYAAGKRTPEWAAA